MRSPLWSILVFKIHGFWRWKQWDQNFVPLDSGIIHINESKNPAKMPIFQDASPWATNSTLSCPISHWDSVTAHSPSDKELNHSSQADEEGRSQEVQVAPAHSPSGKALNHSLIKMAVFQGAAPCDTNFTLSCVSRSKGNQAMKNVFLSRWRHPQEFLESKCLMGTSYLGTVYFSCVVIKKLLLSVIRN